MNLVFRIKLLTYTGEKAKYLNAAVFYLAYLNTSRILRIKRSNKIMIKTITAQNLYFLTRV